MASDPVAICPFIIKNINIGIWNPKPINTHLSDNTLLGQTEARTGSTWQARPEKAEALGIPQAV